MIQVMVSNNIILNTMASKSPISLALGCCASGNLFETIEIKIMLSTPRIISSTVKVNKAVNTAGSVRLGKSTKKNMLLGFCYVFK